MSLVDKMESTGRVVSPLFHTTVAIFIVAFLSVIILSLALNVEIVARGDGKIVPLNRVQLIQPEYSGKIKEILVKNGDLVKKGQPLIIFNKIDIMTELNKLNEEKKRLVIEQQRLNSLINLLEDNALFNSVYVEEILSDFASKQNSGGSLYIQEQYSLLKSEIEEIKGLVNKINAQVKSRKESEQVIVAEISRIKASKDMQKEQFSIAEKLVVKGGISRARYLESLASFNDVDNELTIAYRRLEQNISTENALNTEKKSVFLERRRAFLQRMSEIENSLTILREDIVAAKRKFEGMVVKAPVSGFVDQMTVFTIGGVANAGDELMKIVPDGTDNEIEALFSNRDVGFIEEGQEVIVKLDAFPAERFGFLRGVVNNVSADAIEMPTKDWGFVVRIEPSTPYLETPTNKYPLHSGMTATIDVITGERTLISYFFAPILKTVQDSMGER